MFGTPTQRPTAPTSQPTTTRPTTSTTRPSTPAPSPAPSPAPAPEPTPEPTPATETPPTGAEAPLTPETPGAQPTLDPNSPQANTTENRRLFSLLSSMLGELRLGGLYSVDASGAPSGWLWDRIINNSISEATLEFEIEQTDEYKRRFPAVEFLKSEARAGRFTGPPTAATVIEYEREAKRILQGAQLPPEFYDNDTEDLQGLMMKGISTVELEQRVGQSWARVQSTNPAIRQAFSDFYGVGNGDSALAAFFLDPNNMTQNLDRMSRSAYTAGIGRQAGVGLDKATAERITTMTTNDAQIDQGIGQLSEYSTLFDEGITETQDLSVEGAGVDAAFGNNAEARSALERRLISRQANRGLGGGGAVQTQRGLIGTGNA
jgi:hypothetical protein